ncbi:hypothetical protein GGR52DRAFT_54221 [Hypoxylon sp. FL1284]|nr:hypothetical protein GGR52DRAFT_54221 [Hypoxylon sp. FL1284]
MRQTPASAALQEAATITPRQPRLRSSCDGCGAAKLKCDRTHPECGRCRALGLTCVYGISRKFGKPQRGREAQAMDLRAELPKSLAYVPQHTEYPMSMDMDKFEGQNEYASITMPDFDPLSGPNTIYDNTINNNPVNGTVKSDPCTDLFSNFDSLDFDEWLLSRQHNDSLWTPNFLELSSSLEASRPQWRGNSITHQPEKAIYDQDSSSIAGTQNHDCSREAHELLNSLSFDNPNKTSHSPPLFAMPSGESISFDYILRANREAVERLSRLLNCHCARSPPLALLYASIFSRVLNWYQRAAGVSTEVATHRTSTSSSSASASISGASPLPWSGTAVTPENGNTSTMAYPAGLGLMNTQMAMGSFNLDEQYAQAILNLKQVLSEMKLISGVIDIFSSREFHYSDGHESNDLSLSSGVDSLYTSLSLWLRGEHSRVGGMIRSRLRELSDSMHS